LLLELLERGLVGDRAAPLEAMGVNVHLICLTPRTFVADVLL